MRYVERSKVTAPEVLSKKLGLGEKETKNAVEYYEKLLGAAIIPQPKAKFNFKIYKDVSVKTALESLFLGKCSYCESRYLNTHPVDIEHWRPKAMVLTGANDEPRHGYYWLAAAWDNLLPSCIDCNRVRKHFDYLERKVINLGKGNRFPLLVESDRASRPAELAREQPLLINPCLEDPSQYLEFYDDGSVQAKLDKFSGKPHSKGVMSIRYYALNRSALVQERRERVLLIKQKMLTIKSLAKCLDEANLPAEVAEIIEDLLAHEFSNLTRFESPEQPFSTMAGQLILKFKDHFK